MDLLKEQIDTIKKDGLNNFLEKNRRTITINKLILEKLSDEDLFSFANKLKADSVDPTIYVGAAAKHIYANYTASFDTLQERKLNPALNRDVTNLNEILAI